MLLINASQWPQTNFGDLTIYSPNPALLDFANKNPGRELFWRDMVTEFACVIYNHSQHKIIAVRDHFGVEPCYYHKCRDQFIFGSTIPAILKHMPQPPAINTLQIHQLFFNKAFNAEVYSDETFYTSVYRLEPGYALQITYDGSHDSYQKTSFWDLKERTEPIHYANTMDYVAHFSALLSDALTVQTKPNQKLAAEFSGGLDSSAIIAAAFQHKIHPTLFMHMATPGSSHIDDQQYAEIVIKQLNIKNVHTIDAHDFDLEESMQMCAQYYGGAAPYIGSILANSLHRAVARGGYDTLLSGVGGDECVSSHAPLKAYIPQCIHEIGYQKAWHELSSHYQARGKILPTTLKRVLQLLKLANPSYFAIMEQFSDIGYRLKTYLKDLPHTAPLPYEHSLGEYERNLLQGATSHHLRMRVEYNAVAGKSMGFHYRYPLLYPPLVDFCYRLPLDQKRLNGGNRCLIRHYLAQFFPPDLYNKHTKTGGVSPAAFDTMQNLSNTGAYHKLFHNLPFKTERQHLQKHLETARRFPFRQDIPAYMFKSYWTLP